MDSPRALVIEDAADTARLLEFHLRRAGFEVQIAGTGAAGLARAVAWRPRVVVLSRKELLRRVWGQRRLNQRVVDVTMHRLRGALREQAAMIETVHESGYRLRGTSQNYTLTETP